MKTILARNVNHALPVAVLYFNTPSMTRRVSPRGQVTLEMNEPLATTYLDPCERVLFEPKRNANPFFHLWESLWILAGWNDVSFLTHFLPRMREFSDGGNVFHGAYGARARNASGTDQISNVIEELQYDPDSRRAVIGLWQPEHDSGYRGKDMPCNTTVYFKIRDGQLHMTVCNRSNDMIWGAYGANVVQFSVIQEYIAAQLNVGVGRYTQFSDSFHVYAEREDWTRLKGLSCVVDDPYQNEEVQPSPLVTDPHCFDGELLDLLIRAQHLMRIEPQSRLVTPVYRNTFLHRTAAAMFNALQDYRYATTHETALRSADLIEASDWKRAVIEWIDRRVAA